MENILDKNLFELQEKFNLFNWPTFRAKQVFLWLHKKLTFEFEQMTDLPTELRSQLKEKYCAKVPNVKCIAASKDSAKKYLFELSNGHLIESVLLKDETDRKTICLSTQVGCPLDCAFCATGGMGFKRNLQPSEIIGQVYEIAKEYPDLSNLVFMGMGEPFLNYENTLKAINILTSKEGANFGQRKITISTCGIPDGIRSFAREESQVRLAVSLNSADDRIRSQLMPVNRKHPLSKLIEAVKYYIKETGRRVTIEYVMLDGINDREGDAEKLLRLCRSLSVNVNLVLFNPTTKKFKPSRMAAVKRFQELLSAGKINAVIRRSRGQDIQAACGQLAGE